ncbi:hypothetical protein D4R42_03710 [bacterium]|nr:MAG: hypothetical protein D4R42_03710 [bacterium]
MGNRWGIITQENTGTFSDHTKYTTPELEFDFVDWDPELQQNNQLEFTSGYDMKRYHWLEALNGRVKLENYLAGDNVGEFLKSALGEYGITASVPAYRHKFEPDQAGTAWTLEVYDSDFVNFRTLQGIQVTNLEILARARSIATMNWEGIYADEVLAAVGATTIGTMPAVRPFVFYDGSVSVEAAQARAESFRVRFQPQIPEDTHTLGARDRQYLVKEGTIITAEVELSMADYTNLARYYGGSALLAPADEDEVISCEFTLDGPTLPGGAGEYDQYKMLINLPAMVMTGHRGTINRRGRRTERVELEALYDVDNYIYLYNMKDTYVAA